MDRVDNLKRALETWYVHEEVNEIIVVDWMSKTSVFDQLEKSMDSRVVVVRANTERSWVLSLAYNLAASFAKYDKILKLDADIQLLSGFFEQHHLVKNCFFSGNGKLARNDNERHLNGVVYLNTSDFFTVGGYNEYITSYGWDDGDLYERLQRVGLMRLFINNDYFYHLPHEDRHKNQENPWPDLCLSDREISFLKNLSNRILAEEYFSWSSLKKQRTYKVRQIKEGYFEAKDLNNTHYNIPAKILNDCHRRAFIKLILRKNKKISLNSINHLSFDEIKSIVSELTDI